MKMPANIIAVCVLLGCLAMGFTYKKQEEIKAAIGSLKEVSPALQRALTPGRAFEPLAKPKPGEWLAEHHEAGQTFDQFVRSKPFTPTPRRNRIYLQPLGGFSEGLSPSVEKLETFASAFFMMDVEVEPPLPIDGTGIKARRNPYTGNLQMLTTDVLAFLKKRLPRDAFCALAVTMEDLYPDPSWNFVFGQASLRDRVGVFSFARYNPAFYGERPGRDIQKILLRRSCKVLAHETGHMFQLEHCVFFRCLMNGSNHLEESDSRPLFLCPACLRKLQYSVGFDVVERYRRLLSFYNDVGFTQEAEWLSDRLKTISMPE
jgi:archaemetzincin